VFVARQPAPTAAIEQQATTSSDSSQISFTDFTAPKRLKQQSSSKKPAPTKPARSKQLVTKSVNTENEAPASKNRKRKCTEEISKNPTVSDIDRFKNMVFPFTRKKYTLLSGQSITINNLVIDCNLLIFQSINYNQ